MNGIDAHVLWKTKFYLYLVICFDNDLHRIVVNYPVHWLKAHNLGPANLVQILVLLVLAVWFLAAYLNFLIPTSLTAKIWMIIIAPLLTNK